MFYFNKWYFIKITNVTKFSLYYFYVIYWALHFLFPKISSSKVIRNIVGAVKEPELFNSF